jgi:hypothetical protein
MEYIFILPIEKFERSTPKETILEAWENGDVERYSVKDFAERINDDIFQDMANWVCVIDVKKRYSEIYSFL